MNRITFSVVSHFTSILNISEFNEHTDQVQSIAWKGDGSLLISSCKDKKIRIIDPRKNCLVGSTNGHGGIRDSRSLWCGDTNYTLSTGFSEVFFILV